MSNKSYKKEKNRSITKETVIIAALVSFIVGYATHSLVVSYSNFGTEKTAQIEGHNLNTTVPQVQAQTQAPVATSVDDTALLERVKTNPNDLQSWIQLGNLYFDNGLNQQAIDPYNKALELDPDNANVWTDLGIMYRRTGNISDAINSFNKARDVDPSHKMSLFNKGIVFYYDMGNVDGAVEIWKGLMRDDKNFLMPNGEKLSNFLKSIN